MLNRLFYNLSSTIIIFVFTIFAISNIGFVFHLPVQSYYIYLSFMAAAIYLFFLNKNNRNDYLKQIGIFVLLIYSAILFSSFLLDYSFDGLAYHFQDMYLLKNGWNPVYTDATTFSHLMNLYSNQVWVQGWSKFCEIVSANFYLISGSISSGQIVNFLMAYAAFMSVFCGLDKLQNKTNMNLLFSVLLLINPVVIGQIFTMYIDLQVYFAFLIILSILIQIEKSDTFSINNYFIFSLVFTIFMHVKFSAFFYLLIISTLYFIYLLYLKKYLNIKRYFASGLLGLFLTIVLGAHPFYTNYHSYGHPFYPLLGKHKQDVIERQITIIELKNKTSVQKAIMSTFAVQTNYPGHIEYRLPFKIKKISLYESDTRIGGMGHFWSGILIISLIFSFGIRYNTKEDKSIFIMMFSTIWLSYLFYPDPWWMRYVPQIWIFPVLVLYLSLNYGNSLFLDKNYIKQFYVVFMTLLLLSNSLIVTYENQSLTLEQQKERISFYKMLSYVNNGVLIYPLKDAAEGNSSIYAYLDKYNVKYSIVSDKDYYKNKSAYEPMELFSVFKKTYFWKKAEE